MRNDKLFKKDISLKEYTTYTRKLKKIEDLESLMKLEYFARVLDFSDDNDFVYYIRNTISRLISDPSINSKESKKVKKDADDASTAYDNDSKEKLLQIFNDNSHFSEQDREIIRKGTIRQKLKTLDFYLNTVDDLDYFVELASLLELLEEYVVYKPIDILAEKLEKIKRELEKSDINLNSNYGKGNSEALSSIMNMLELFYNDNVTKDKNSKISELIKGKYEAGDLDIKDITKYISLSNAILEQLSYVR